MSHTAITRQHVTIKVTGHVQGVTFRAHTKRLADGLGITGYAQNNPDGTVTIEAEGDADSLHELLDWCHIGPRRATISHVTVEPGSLQYFTDFRTH